MPELVRAMLNPLLLYFLAILESSIVLGKVT